MIEQTEDWSVIETNFAPEQLHHSETIFTIGNGYMGTRGAFEEAFPGEVRSTFLHGVFDDVPVFFTELANAPDWMELEIILEGERFGLDYGTLLAFERCLDLKTATLHRQVRWRSPNGRTTRLAFERFTSLENVHLAGIRVSITPEDYDGTIEIRSGVNGEVDNLGVKHWEWQAQAVNGHSAWLHCRTRTTQIELAMGIRLDVITGSLSARFAHWDVRNHPTLAAGITAHAGEAVTGIKWVTLFTSRDGRDPVKLLKKSLREVEAQDWDAILDKHIRAWKAEWDRCDILIEGDPEAQLAIRFNLFQLLIAAPRSDSRVNIGAKTLSGYGYRGHSFWDTEIFMLPFYTYTHPEIARNLLSYRWINLPGALRKARENGYQGAQYPWESAGDGEEVTPTWVQNPDDRMNLIRIWTGDIEIHITADIVYAIWQYCQATGDDKFLLERGAEVILEAARFWASRVEWKAGANRFEISDIIGPDEYHDHVNNNAYTNMMARWNLQTALELVCWLREHHPARWKKLHGSLSLRERELTNWQHIVDRIYISYDPQTKLVEQFDGYFQRKDINLTGIIDRTESVQAILGIEGVNETQIIKQPDVLMLMYLHPDLFDAETIRINYDYYTRRTDHTFGSSLGPSIQAIMACRVDNPDAYEHFMRAARADLNDVRGNAGDGVHGASAGGLWQAVVFGFAGLRLFADRWEIQPRLPAHWQRLCFRFLQHGQIQTVDIHNP
jgi:trehalose/maltose hydrolase-like predicted phosphorylase